jgi:hypothetical protein
MSPQRQIDELDASEAARAALSGRATGVAKAAGANPEQPDLWLIVATSRTGGLCAITPMIRRYRSPNAA